MVLYQSTMAETDQADHTPPKSDNMSKVSARPPTVGVNGKPRPMTRREVLFAQVYAHPDSPTFFNGKQSMLKVAPNLTDGSAAMQASRLLDRDNVKQSITDILNKANLGIEVRADTIHSILSTKDIGATTTETVKGEDGTSKVVTRRAPGYAHVLKAIDLVNKMDGLYERNQAAADVAVSEWRELSKRIFGPAPRRAGGGGLTSRRGSDVSLVQNAGEENTSGGK